MSRPTDHAKEGNLSVVMNIRVTLDERKQLQAMAAARETTVSDLIWRGLQLQGLELERKR